MSEKQFQIYIPNKWKWLGIDLSFLILFLLIGGICIISEKYLPDATLTDVFYFMFLLLLISITIVMLFGAKIREPLHGKIEGVLELKVDEIRINDRSIPISNIKKISFVFVDYWDMQWAVWGRQLTARKSQGNNNKCEIETYNGEMIRLQFRRMSSKEQYIFKNEFFEYYLSDKLAFIELTRMLDCNSYNAIQSLKKEIEEFKNNKISAHIIP